MATMVFQVLRWINKHAGLICTKSFRFTKSPNVFIKSIIIRIEAESFHVIPCEGTVLHEVRSQNGEEEEVAPVRWYCSGIPDLFWMSQNNDSRRIGGKSCISRRIGGKCIHILVCVLLHARRSFIRRNSRHRGSFLSPQSIPTRDSFSLWPFLFKTAAGCSSQEHCAACVLDCWHYLVYLQKSSRVDRLSTSLQSSVNRLQEAFHAPLFNSRPRRYEF